jgi:HK97 family phage major capsid protein
MSKQGMTREELGDFVVETSIPALKNQLGEDVAKLVSDNIEKMASDPNGPWAKATNTAGGLLNGRPQSAPKQREKGIAFARVVRAMAAARMHKMGAEGATNVLRGWGDDDIADTMQSAQTKALAAGDATAGGFLVPTEFSNEVIELLRAQSVVRKLGARTIQMPTGTLKFPKIATGANATYIGENVNIGKSEETFGQLTLTFKKLAVLTPISNDLLRYSSPSADAIVRDDLVSAMATKEDTSFLRGAGTDATPKGLLNWCLADQKIASNLTVNLANITDDLGQLVVKLKQADIPMISPGWIMAPRTEQKLATIQNANGAFVFRDEIIRGTLWGWPVGVTTNVPITLDTTGAGSDNESEIYLVDFAQVIIGESAGLLVDSSQEAAYHDGSNVQAAFSLDQTVVRAIAEHDLGMRHDKAIAMLTGVTWTP